jgi:hypothetical protein
MSVSKSNKKRIKKQVGSYSDSKEEKVEIRPLTRKELFYRERGERVEWENLESIISISEKLFLISMAFVFGNYNLGNPDKLSTLAFFISSLFSFVGLIPMFGRKVPLISTAIIEEIKRLSYIKWYFVLFSASSIFVGIIIKGLNYFIN